MPELPEVETVRRRVAPCLRGERIHLVRRSGPDKIFETGDPKTLIGFDFSQASRHGKYLLLHFHQENVERILVIHLGMTGQLTFAPAGVAPANHFRRLPSGYQKALSVHTEDRHTHLALEFESGDRLLFRDPRRFGRILVLAPEALPACPRLARLGPDALGFPETEFVRRFREHAGARSVKALLLDQSFLAGIGNIYADESCFTAGIRPTAVSRHLSVLRIRRLAAAVTEALDRGIRNAGTTFRDFILPDGSEGHNQEDLNVYARAGEPCLRCGSKLVKSVVAGRGTVWCPRCQRN